MTGATRPSPGPFAYVAMTLALMAMAFLIVMVAGENEALGPLDLAAADVVALAIWSGAPVVGGLVAGRIQGSYTPHAAIALGLIVSSVVGLVFLFGSGTGSYACSLDLGRIPHALGVVMVGILTGAGVGLAFALAAIGAARAATAVPGAVVAFIVVVSASLGAKNSSMRASDASRSSDRVTATRASSTTPCAESGGVDAARGRFSGWGPVT